MNKRILNIGCGNDSYGTDFVDLYPSRPDVKRCDIDNDKLPYRNNIFHEVYSKCLLEHLKNPGRALNEIVRVLKPNGKIVIITDNAGWWGFHTPLSSIHYGGYEKNSKVKEDRHYSLFTTWHLVNHLQALKLRNIEVRYVYIGKETPHVLVRIISKLLFMIGLRRIAYPHILAEAMK